MRALHLAVVARLVIVARFCLLFLLFRSTSKVAQEQLVDILIAQGSKAHDVLLVMLGIHGLVVTDIQLYRVAE